MSRQNQYRLSHSQNFLVNERIVESLVDAANFSTNDTVVEVGPGKGVITFALARHAGHVLAFEKDEQLAEKLVGKGRLPGNVTLFVGDFLDAPLPVTPYRMFANIPFRHTSAIVGKLTTGTAPPIDARLVMQSEAADRYLIGNSSTLQAQLQHPFRHVEVVHRFHRQDFRPTPGVDSVMLLIAKRQHPYLALEHAKRYEDFLTSVFSAWKPNLKESLATVLPASAFAALANNRYLNGFGRTKVSQVPAEAWIAIFDQLLALDEGSIWQSLERTFQKVQMNRANLEKSSRTTTRRHRT